MRTITLFVLTTMLACGSAGAAEPAADGLSLEQAIHLAIANNLQTLLAGERAREASGEAGEALSSLMPNLSGLVSQYRSTTNLRAQGLDFPGLPSLVGPFNTFDARARLVQTVFNLSAWRQHQAADTGVEVAQLQEKLAREQVASATTLAYVDVLRARQAVTAAQANLDLAAALKQLADDRHKVGVASGLDVARAATRLAQSQTTLIQAQSATQQTTLQLQRLLGVSLGGNLTLTDSLNSSDTPALAVDSAVAQADKARYELRIAEKQLLQSDYERRAAAAGRLPTLAVVGDFGRSANLPNENSEETYRYGAQVEIPIFNGGLTNSRLDVAASHKRQAELQAADLRQQVEQDVRQSLVDLKATTDRLHATQVTQDLAERELQLSRDRFAAGAADNIEVINAQAVLADARNDLVVALTAYNTARASLAAALGQAESFRL